MLNAGGGPNVKRFANLQVDAHNSLIPGLLIFAIESEDPSTLGTASSSR
jgi:hypothetical protein